MSRESQGRVSNRAGSQRGAPTQYAKGGNPYMGQAAVVNHATYLGGGRDFGAFPDARRPHIVSRNLTSDYRSMAEGGMSEDMFLLTIRTGVDHDLRHPTCTGAPDGRCIPPPFNGSLLQVMSWPVYRNLTDDDLKPIYACLRLQSLPGGWSGGTFQPLPGAGPEAGPGGSQEPDCIGPGDCAGRLQIDERGRQTLAYSWSIPPGSPTAAILHGDSAMPTVQFSPLRGAYTFLLTVTDSSGRTSTDLTTVDSEGN